MAAALLAKSDFILLYYDHFKCYRADLRSYLSNGYLANFFTSLFLKNIFELSMHAWFTLDMKNL